LNRAHGKRLPGSAIMPFVYLSALDQYTPTSWLNDEPATYTDNGTSWTPRNLDDRYRGRIMLRDALEQSLNAATADLATRVGAQMIAATFRRLGLDAPSGSALTLALGDFPVTALALAGAYAALDNDGQKPYLLGVKEVVAENGEIQERRHVEFLPVTSPAKAYLITNILERAVKNGATSQVKNLVEHLPFAAQPGISVDGRDSWFIGYTTDLLTVIWVGYDDSRPLSPHASQVAARIWLRFINQVRPWLQPQEFRMPPEISQRLICLESGQLAASRCREKRLEVFLDQHVPRDYCTLHN
jgi:penicillin-binding protein 1B